MTKYLRSLPLFAVLAFSLVASVVPTLSAETTGTIPKPPTRPPSSAQSVMVQVLLTYLGM